MTQQPTVPVEQAAEAHARHIVAGDRVALYQDCAVLGHARIGLQHVFKIRYVGTPTVTLHHRLGAVDGRWLVLESERV